MFVAQQRLRIRTDLAVELCAGCNRKKIIIKKKAIDPNDNKRER